MPFGGWDMAGDVTATGPENRVQSLLAQLDAEREELRKVRHRTRAEADEARRLSAAADADRKLAGRDRERARGAYAKFMARLKKRWQAEKNQIAAARADILAERHQLEADREAFAAERRAFLTDAELYKRRLADAWEMIADGHRRLLADRTAAEDAIRTQEESLAAREAALNAAEESSASTREKLRSENDKLLAEVSGLETRAFHLNLKVQELEQARAAATAGLAVATAAGAPTDLFGPVDLNAPIPLDRRYDKSFDQLVTEIAAKEEELAKEQQAVAKAKTAFDGLAKELADQRAVLAEQFAKFAAARDTWQRAETVTVKELEELARSVERREKAVVHREAAGARADQDRQTRQRELGQFRLKLEAWQAGLTAHEASWYANRDKAEAEIDRKREHVVHCEQALSAMAAEWATAWKAERDALKQQYAAAIDDRQKVDARTFDLDRRTAELAKQAEKVAALSVALEQARTEWAGESGPRAEKRMRVAQKRWERHFARVGKDLDARRSTAQAATKEWDKKCRDVQKTLATLAERTAAAVEKERSLDQKTAKEVREEGDRAVILSIETARRKRSEQEAEELRGEVERMAKVLLASDTGADVIPLSKAA